MILKTEKVTDQENQLIFLFEKRAKLKICVVFMIEFPLFTLYDPLEIE